eukprot:560356_1
MAEQSGPPDRFSANQKVLKRITIYNQSDVHIKVIATEREEMKQGRDTKKEANRQEIESDINTTSHPQNRNTSTSSDSPNDSEHNTKLKGTAKKHDVSQSDEE